MMKPSQVYEILIRGKIDRGPIRAVTVIRSLEEGATRYKGCRSEIDVTSDGDIVNMGLRGFQTSHQHCDAAWKYARLIAANAQCIECATIGKLGPDDYPEILSQLLDTSVPNLDTYDNRPSCPEYRPSCCEGDRDPAHQAIVDALTALCEPMEVVVPLANVGFCLPTSMATAIQLLDTQSHIRWRLTIEGTTATLQPAEEPGPVPKQEKEA